MKSLAARLGAWSAAVCLLAGSAAASPFFSDPQISSCRSFPGYWDYNPLPTIGVTTDTGTPTLGIQVQDPTGLKIGPGPFVHSTGYPGLVALWYFDHVNISGTIPAASDGTTHSPSGTSGNITTYAQCSGTGTAGTDPGASSCAALGKTAYSQNMVPYITSDDSNARTALLYGAGGTTYSYYASHSGDNENVTDAGSSWTGPSASVVFATFPNSDNCIWEYPASCDCTYNTFTSFTESAFGFSGGEHVTDSINCSNTCAAYTYDAGCDDHSITDIYNYSLPTLTSGPGGGSPTGTRVYFNGSQQQYIQLNSGGLSLINFTYEAWVYPTAVNGGYNPIMGQGTGGTSEAYIGLDSGTGKFIAWAGNRGLPVYSNNAVALNNWYLVTATYQAQTVTNPAVLSLYVNGVFQSSTSVVWGGTNSAFIMGADHDGEYYTGYLNDAMVLSQVIGPQQAAADYDPTVYQFSPTQFGLTQTSSYIYGPGASIGYDSPAPSDNSTTTGVVTLRTPGLPLIGDSSPFVQWIAQNSAQETSLLESAITVTTSAPTAPTINAVTLSNSSLQWTVSENYICNAHRFDLNVTQSGSTSCASNAVGATDCRQFHNVASQPSIGTFILSGLTPNEAAGLNGRSETQFYGTSPLTATVTAYTYANTPSSVQPSVFNSSSMTITWNSNGNPAYTPYELTYSANDPTFNTWVSTPEPFTALYTATSAVLTNLAPSTTYYFRARAANGNGGYPGGGVSTAFSTTLDGSVPYPTLAQAPAVTAYAESTVSVVWSWNPVPTAQNYAIWDPTGQVPDCPDYATSFDYNLSYPYCSGLSNNAALGPNTRVGLRFRTVNSSGNGPLGPAIYRYTLANPPQNLVLASVSSATLTLSWTANNNPSYTTYQIAASLDPGFSSVDTSTYTSTANSITLSGLYPGTSFYFQVRAVNGDGVPSAVSNAVAAVTPLAPGQTQTALPANSAANVTGADGQTQVNVPGNALASGATIFMSVNPLTAPILVNTTLLQNSLTLTPENQDYISGSAREFVAVVGNQVSSAPFSLPFTIRIPFSDSQQPGIIDGSNPPIPVASLKAYTLNPYVEGWNSVPSSVDTPDSVVLITASHFSVYALFGTPLSSPANTSEVRVFPQPWEPGTGGKYDNATAAGLSGLVFQNLPENATVKIFTLQGELVRTLQSEIDGAGCACSVAVWDGNNSSGHKAASGIYLAYVNGGGSSKVMKIAIER